MTEFKVEVLGPRHNRDAFSCGVATLDRYLKKQASQDVSKRVAATFVITPDGATIAGFYVVAISVGASFFKVHEPDRYQRNCGVIGLLRQTTSAFTYRPLCGSANKTGQLRSRRAV